MIAVGGFTNTADVAIGVAQWMPLWMAKSLTSKCRFDNLSKIRAVTCPILLVYGTEDTVVPPWMADRLAESATSPVTKIAAPCSHNSLWKPGDFGLNNSVRDWIQAR